MSDPASRCAAQPRRRRARSAVRLLASISTALAAWVSPADSRSDQPTASDAQGMGALTELSLEDLMNVEVTSVSRKREPLSDAAAAVYVITQEDIRRSGARSLPEVLRLAPGLQVARIDSDDWGISARGFAWLFANKMLVLIDGRSVYTRLFSGVYWQMQDLPLTGIERIEVIRGPGGALWGANAVNGVINVITKRAGAGAEHQVEAGSGSEEPGYVAGRVNGRLGKSATYRLSGSFASRDALVDGAGFDFGDQWSSWRARTRLDWQVSPRDEIQVFAGALGGRSHQRVNMTLPGPPYQQLVTGAADFSGAWGMGRWDRVLSSTSELSGAVWVETMDRDDLLARQAADVVNVEMQHRFSWGNRRELQWGLGYRREWFGLAGNYTFSMGNGGEHDQLLSGFAQVSLPLWSDDLKSILGAKLESASQSDFEAQPSARLLWTPTGRQTWWAAVSRAVRTPSMTERYFRYNVSTFPVGSSVGVASLFGTRDLRSESLVAWELGGRAALGRGVWVDLAGFYNRYDDLLTSEPGAPYQESDPAPEHTVFPQRVGNQMSGHSFGAETAAQWQVLPSWRLSGTATWLQMNLELDSSSSDVSSVAAGREHPRLQANLRSYLDVTDRLELDAAGYYVARIHEGDVPAYFRLDLRTSFRFGQGLRLTAGAENLLQEHHREIGADIAQTPAEAQRAFYAQVGIEF